MKYLLLLVFCVIVSSGSLITSNDNKAINFKYDIHPDSPIGLVMEGKLDPMNDLNNKITTFLKIAKSYIPILKTIGEKEQGLLYRRIYRINFPGFDILIDIYVQLLIGWRVDNASSQTSYFNVTYVPFAQGWMTTIFNGTALPGNGWYTVDVQLINASAPIGIQIYSNKVCFGGSWGMQPVTLVTKMHTALQECGDEIIDEIINQTPINLKCNLTAPLEFNHLNITLSKGQGGSLIDYKCITF